MGIISDGVSITQNGYINTFSNIEQGQRYRRLNLGYMPTYQYGVIPLVCLDQSVSIGHESYTSGRIEFCRSNGCCYKGGDYVDFKMQKNYNSNSSYHWTEYHRNSQSVVKCRFTWNGKPWAGIKIYSSVHGHNAWFQGQAENDDVYQFGDPNYTWYIPIYNSSTSSVLNSEIYNSIVYDG